MQQAREPSLDEPVQNSQPIRINASSAPSNELPKEPLRRPPTATVKPFDNCQETEELKSCQTTGFGLTADRFSSHHWKVRTVELCCGCARFSLHLMKAGMTAIAVDKVLNRHKALIPILTIDLCTDAGQAVVMLMVVSGEIDYAHASPPCGTASRAREKKIPASLKRLGAFEPKPLRSNQHPKGLPTLTGVDALRVVLANRIYNFLAALFTTCTESGLPWSCENPKNSYLWLMAAWVKLLADPRVKPYEYDACCYGGKRRKRSVWYSNMTEFSGLVAYCDNSHKHASWTQYKHQGRWKFPTAEEAEYPPELCKVATECVLAHFVAKLNIPVEELPQPELVSVKQTTLGQQRGTQRPLVPEFSSVEVLNSNFAPKCDLGELGTVGDPGSLQGCKLLRLSRMGGYGTNSDQDFQSAWGRFWTSQEFVSRALAADHPARHSFGIDDTVASLIHDILTSGAAAIARKRLMAARHWESRAKLLQTEEDSLRVHWTVQQREILRGKRLLVFKEMIAAAGHGDTGIVDEIIEGARLTGSNKDSHVFQKVQPVAIAISVQELKNRAKWVQRALFAKCRASEDENSDNEVWKTTMDEQAKGWLSGPFDAIDDVSRHLGSAQWIPSPRFGLRQGKKVRAIDNYTAGGVNAAFSANERVALQGIDHVAALAKAMNCSVNSRGQVEVRSLSGKVFSG